MFRIVKIIFIALIISLSAIVFYYSGILDVKAMARISDRISQSWPNTEANHTISFLNTVSIPPAGKIVITPESGEFMIPAGFDHLDIDLATSSTGNGLFNDRILAATSSAFADGVYVVSGTTNGSITITLNSTYGIESGVYVQIELGINSSFGGSADSAIINPGTIGSFDMNIATLDEYDQTINISKAMVAMVEPVTMSARFYKTRSYAAPIGWLAFDTTETIMSLVTNFPSTCRYSAASGTPYADMANSFYYASSTMLYNYHTVLLTGLQNNEQYDYYVRCRDEDGVADDSTLCLYLASSTPYVDINSLDCVDYWLHFGLKGQEGDIGDEIGDGGDSGGGTGGGDGGGGGGGIGAGSGELLPFPPPPGAPSLVLQGWAYPFSLVTVTKDGIKETTETAVADSSFYINIYNLTQGVYTFGLWAEDNDKRKSITESFTFYVKDGTKTEIYEIIIPPTIEIKKNEVEPGEVVEIFGYSAPNSTVEAWMFPDKINVDDTEIMKNQALADASGRWSIFFNTTDAAGGKYKIKAKTNVAAAGESDFSNALNCGVGVEVDEGICQGADLNGDGKVNLTDFSILLYYWGTGYECADQNKDGTVNLTDFSIMMYYWTG